MRYANTKSRKATADFEARRDSVKAVLASHQGLVRVYQAACPGVPVTPIVGSQSYSTRCPRCGAENGLRLNVYGKDRRGRPTGGSWECTNAPACELTRETGAIVADRDVIGLAKLLFNLRFAGEAIDKLEEIAKGLPTASKPALEEVGGAAHLYQVMNTMDWKPPSAESAPVFVGADHGLGAIAVINNTTTEPIAHDGKLRCWHVNSVMPFRTTDGTPVFYWVFPVVGDSRYTVTPCRIGDRVSWSATGWPADIPRPLWNADKLAARPDAPVLLCLSDRDARDAAKILADSLETVAEASRDLVVTTPLAHPHTVFDDLKRSDLTPLAGRTVYIVAARPPKSEPDAVYGAAKMATAIASFIGFRKGNGIAEIKVCFADHGIAALLQHPLEGLSLLDADRAAERLMPAPPAPVEPVVSPPAPVRSAPPVVRHQAVQAPIQPDPLPPQRTGHWVKSRGERVQLSTFTVEILEDRDIREDLIHGNPEGHPETGVEYLKTGAAREYTFNLHTSDGHVRRFDRLGGTDFESMKFLTGAGLVASGGLRNPTRIRALLEQIALDNKGHPVKTVYRQLGWRVIDDTGERKIAYLGGYKAITADGILENHISDPGLGPNYKYDLRPGREDHELRFSELQALLDLMKGPHLVALTSALFRAPLGQLNTMIHVYGHTGVYKSALMAVLMTFFGPRFTGKALGTSWNAATYAAMQKLLTKVRDIPGVHEDWAPRDFTDPVTAKLMYQKLNLIARAVGNQYPFEKDGSASGQQQEKLIPQGSLFSTGEEPLYNESVDPRTLQVRIAKGDISGPKLREMQVAGAEGRFRDHMYSYVKWLAKPENFRSYTYQDPDTGRDVVLLQERAAKDLKAQLKVDAHERLYTNAAEVARGWYTAKHWMQDIGMLTASEAEDLWNDRLWPGVIGSFKIHAEESAERQKRRKRFRPGRHKGDGSFSEFMGETGVEAAAVSPAMASDVQAAGAAALALGNVAVESDGLMRFLDELRREIKAGRVHLTVKGVAEVKPALLGKPGAGVHIGEVRDGVAYLLRNPTMATVGAKAGFPAKGRHASRLAAAAGAPRQAGTDTSLARIAVAGVIHQAIPIPLTLLEDA